jgi:dTDP-glucose 4,6-dehydratase
MNFDKNNMFERILVVGGNSFSGSHFAAELVNKGQNVLSISRSDRVSSLFLPEKWNFSKKISVPFKKIDLRTDTEELYDLVNDFRPELVVNFAAQGMVAESWERPIDWYQTNVLAQISFHDVLRGSHEFKRYVHVTTPEVYGNCDGWVKENIFYKPSTPYAASRASCDLHLLTYFNGHNFPVVFTRAANVYGAGQQLYRIIPRAIIAALTGQKLNLHGGGLSERSFVHIKDVVDATYQVATSGILGECYHISTNKIISISNLVEEVAKIFGLRLEDICEFGKERLGKDHSYMLDSAKIRSELDWKDTISLEEGLLDVKTWVVENLTEINSMSLNYEHKV